MLSDAELDALRATHGKIQAVRYNGNTLVFRKPTRAQVKAHAMALDNPQERPFADEQLARQTVVYPTREKFASLLEEFPYLTRNEKVGKALGVLCGILEEEEEKDLGSVSSGSGAPQGNTPAA